MLNWPIVRFLATVKCGVAMMILILAYASFASAVAQARGAVEMTEMAIFRHWLFGGLTILFCLSLILTTFKRIPFRWVNAGVLTVHTGLLLLAGGAVWYFGTKVEGDLILESPRVQIVSTSGGRPRVIAEMLAAEGETWSNVLPAFGGELRMGVTAIRMSARGEITDADVAAQVGSEQPSAHRLVANGPLADLVPGRLALRLATFPAADTFYDNESTALYVRRDGDQKPRVLPIEGLPIYRERYLDEGYVLRDALGRPAPSKRIRPAASIAGLDIPTGWFEHWRLPIDLEVGDLPFRVRVTGYVPYISRMDVRAVDGAAELNPAVNLRLLVGQTVIEQSLFADDPAGSMMPGGVPMEFRWVSSEAEKDAMLEPLAGSHELYVEVKNPPVIRTMPIVAGQQIEIDGTPYRLTVKETRANWPLMTPGFEGAASPMASVDVTNGALSYNRTVIQRFPQLSQDIDEKGVRHREGPYDPNLVLRYRSAAGGWVSILGGPKMATTVGVFDPSGNVERTDVRPGQELRMSMLGAAVTFTLSEQFERAERIEMPIIEPIEQRRPSLAPRGASAIRLKFTGTGSLSGRTETRWCIFSQYPDVDVRPLHLSFPGSDEEWEVVYSRAPRELGAELVPGKLSVEFFPGRQSVESWRSDFLVRPSRDGAPRPVAVYTNQTCTVGEWTLFQSGAAGDHWSYTIIGIGNRRGIWTMLLGCGLVTVGCLFAFYIKPIIRRRDERRTPDDSAMDDFPPYSSAAERLPDAVVMAD